MKMNKTGSVEKVRDFSKIPSIVETAVNRGVKELIIEVESGIYEVRGIRVADTGGMKLTIKADGEVRLLGGRRLRGFVPVSDPVIAARFVSGVRGRVLQCDLKENGLTHAGEIVSRGFNRPVVPSHAEIFCNGKPMNLSQYPKRGKYLLIDHMDRVYRDQWNALSGSLEEGFYFSDRHPRDWKPDGDIWVHGYWAYDWANSYERVAELDTERQFLKNAPPYGNFYFHAGQRFCFLNVLEEVTEPGDYYIDREKMLLYFLPLEDEQPDEMMISELERPVFAVADAESICIDGFTIEAVRGHAVTVDGCSNVTVQNCHMRNIGNYAVSIQNSEKIEVKGCTIHDCGDGGVEASGGDRITLKSADIRIFNNHIYRIAQWTRCYQPAIMMTGVGMTASHNMIHDCPHTAIMYWGNEMTVENNEIYSVVMETGDAGAIYSGRDYSFRGNRVCGNFVHHLGGVGMGTMGIYNDDCLSGTDMEDNLFFEVSRAIFLGGGRDFIVKNNTLINCYPAIRADSRGASPNPNWRQNVRNLRERLYHIAPVDKENLLVGEAEKTEKIIPVYLEKYPELRSIDEFYTKEETPFIPSSAVLEGNVICSKRGIEFFANDQYGEYLLKQNYYAQPGDFVDMSFYDFKLREDSIARSFHHKTVDIKEIGLIETERPQNPVRIFSKLSYTDGNLELELRNASTRSGSGTATLYTSRFTEGLSDRTLHVKLSAGEHIAFLLFTGELPADFEIEIRGNTAGIRPARLKVNG